MREKEVEAYLVKRVKDLGGKAYKWVSQGNDGVPDRIVIMPGGTVIFVELKAPGGKLRPLQEAKHTELRKLKQTVFVLDDKNKVDAFIKLSILAGW